MFFSILINPSFFFSCLWCETGRGSLLCGATYVLGLGLQHLRRHRSVNCQSSLMVSRVHMSLATLDVLTFKIAQNLNFFREKE